MTGTAFGQEPIFQYRSHAGWWKEEQTPSTTSTHVRVTSTPGPILANSIPNPYSCYSAKVTMSSSLPALTQVEEDGKAGDFATANEVEVHIWVDGPQRNPQEVNPGVRERVL
jgi:hypothetical protein